MPVSCYGLDTATAERRLIEIGDHPHGGGRGKSKGNRHPVSPWGIPTKSGYKTSKSITVSSILYWCLSLYYRKQAQPQQVGRYGARTQPGQTTCEELVNRIVLHVCKGFAGCSWKCSLHVKTALGLGQENAYRRSRRMEAGYALCNGLVYYFIYKIGYSVEKKGTSL